MGANSRTTKVSSCNLRLDCWSGCESQKSPKFRSTNIPLLIPMLRFFRQPFRDPLLQKPEELLDIGKSSTWVVVVIL